MYPKIRLSGRQAIPTPPNTCKINEAIYTCHTFHQADICINRKYFWSEDQQLQCERVRRSTEKRTDPTMVRIAITYSGNEVRMVHVVADSGLATSAEHCSKYKHINSQHMQSLPRYSYCSRLPNSGTRQFQGKHKYRNASGSSILVGRQAWIP